MEREEFEKLVEKAFFSLPENIRKALDNVEICIEDSPTKLQKRGVKIFGKVLGLYQGIPKIRWGRGFGQILPDKIILFQKEIESLSFSKKEIEELVKIVLWHEIAHHFGFNEKEVKKLERKWRKKLKLNK